ncbi:Ebs1p [Kluyveromyces lactis]|uniref:KLLA0F20702p n=1 Tax=Kluyveromyces lactis (strain ATCC 8585 / CBS 2359 / DSM 70799 / NBRC 1267 / NRRL Y-1140 / WM37) TaxID=284590 RepID=Q6CJ80_KLULA|nr:uncharacterized protein KLLA0_F20702g [Kluyveromyces lactis]CAG98717.1 KLLA0F20702p [Kluyveromyces lactis]|eukprot:XP_456009.1 uncharacterized protein KLLA0_F20702g [Kluyveromyces lactis]
MDQKLNTDLQETFSGFQKQLQSVLETDFFRDDSLMKGAIQMIHSKIMQMLLQSLIPEGLHQDITTDTGSKKSEIRSSDAHRILDLTWKHVHYPIFKYFQNWRNRNVAEGSRPNYAGHRQLNSILQKIFPQIHKLYYSTLELIFANYNLTALIPSDTRSKLNISTKKLNDDASNVLKPEDSFSIDCVMASQRCLLYIGCSQRYKIIMEHLSDRYQQADFQKPLRYLDIASTIVPSVGETFLQRGICYTHTKNFGNAAYQFVRSSLSRLPSDAGIPNFTNLLGDPNGSLFKKLLNSLDDLKVQETIKKRIINMEIMEFYILPLIGSHIFPQTWKNNRHSDRLKHFQTLLFDKIEIRYIKNISMIFQDLILLIGSFHMYQMINGVSSNTTSSAATIMPNDKTLMNGNGSANSINNSGNSNIRSIQSETKFLEFIFKFFTHLIDKVIMKEFKNCEMFQYLAMARIMMCWIKSHKNVLKFAHRSTSFCQSMVNLTNELLSSNDLSISFEHLHRPTRDYFYEEDIMLKEFGPTKFTLSDFNDEKLLSMDNLPDRLVGKSKNKLTAKEEHSSRVQVLVYSNKKFLEKNCCGFKLDTEKKRYVHTAVKRVKANSLPNIAKPESVTKSFSIDGAGSGKIYPQKNGFSVAFTTRENSNASGGSSMDMSTSPHYTEEAVKDNTTPANPVWNYSGSSAPQPPLSFNVTPSFSVSTTVERSENEKSFSLYNRTEMSNHGNNSASTNTSNGSVSSPFSSIHVQSSSSSIPLSSTNTNGSSTDSRENSNGLNEAPKLNVQNLSTFNYLQNASHDSQISIFARDSVVMSSQANNSAGLYEQAQQRTYMGSQYAQFHNPFTSFSPQFDNLQNQENHPQNSTNIRRDSQFFPNNNVSIAGDRLPSMAEKADDQFNFFFYS